MGITGSDDRSKVIVSWEVSPNGTVFILGEELIIVVCNWRMWWGNISLGEKTGRLWGCLWSGCAASGSRWSLSATRATRGRKVKVYSVGEKSAQLSVMMLHSRCVNVTLQ